MNLFLNFLLGAGVGAYGTLVGAGGGFVLVPLFLLLYHLPHEMAVGTSLAVVAANAFSGSLGYVWDRKIDYRAGVLFALATFPGALLGALSTNLVSGPTFMRVFGFFLFCAASYLLWRKTGVPRAPIQGHKGWGWVERRLVTKGGTEHYEYFEPLGLGLSTGVGALSSWLGIGGGIVHVPLLTELLGFPVHVAVATSHFILAWTALVGALVHGWKGHLDLSLAFSIGLGAIVGAQGGVRIARRTKGSWVLKALSLALFVVSLRLLWGN